MSRDQTRHEFELHSLDRESFSYMQIKTVSKKQNAHIIPFPIVLLSNYSEVMANVLFLEVRLLSPGHCLLCERHLFVTRALVRMKTKLVCLVSFPRVVEMPTYKFL